MPSLLIALCASHLAWLAASQPTLSFPFNAQLPPVARIDQFFSYSLSPQTFRSTSNISYSLGEHPEWLSIDHRNGRLYGTPDDDKVPPGEVVGQALSLIATDDTGSASTQATLVVSRKEGPSVQIPLARQSQIMSFGRFSAPSTLLLYPSTEFEYIFDPETFSTPHSLNYYATSNDSSPLPSWLHFDRDRLRFSGKTPAFKSLVQPSQVFDISLVASDIVGFAGAWVSFSILVGTHQLTTDKPIVTLNVAKGSPLRYDRLDEGIKLDNKTLPPGDLDVSVENMPSWLSYDVDNGRLEGTPKDNDHSTNFTINFRDSLQNTLSVLVVVNVQTGLFQTTFENVQARPGDLFSLDLQSYFRDPQDIDLSMESTPGGEWLEADGLSLTGRVPKDAEGGCDVTIDASSRSTGVKERETLHIDFLAADGTAVSSPQSTTPSSQASGVIGSAKHGPAKQHSRQRTIAKILLGTLIPLLFLSILGLLFVCLKNRRRQVGDFFSEKGRAMKYSPTWTRLRATKTGFISLWWIGKVSSMKQLKGSLLRRRHHDESELSSEGSTTSMASSETLRSMSTLEAPPVIMASGRLGTSRHSRTPNSNISRESWFTVEGTMTPNRSETSVQIYQVAANLPGPVPGQDPASTTRRLRDTTDGASFQTTNLSTASLEELSRIQPLAAVACNRHNSVDRQTTTTSSSAALPASFWRNHRLLAHIPGRWPLFPAPLRLNRQASPISEEADAARSSQQPATSCPMLFRSSQEPSDNNRHSVVTSSSFASTENWRIMAWQETSRRLAGQATPHRPPRPVSPPSATGAGEPLAPPDVLGGGLELLSPSKWGDLGGGTDVTAVTGPSSEGAKTGGGADRLTTPPVAGFEIDFDEKFMSDGREGAMRTIRTVLGEGAGKGEKSGSFI